MIKLAIVEDQDFIRDTIVQTFNWASMGIEISGTYENGKQALEGFAHTRPDIVLSDILMPVMDGLKMLERIQQNSWDIQTIFLSGFDDFKYAQQAIRCNAANYLLKPCKTEELESAIIDLKKKIDNKRAAPESNVRMRTADNEGRKHRYLKSLLNDVAPEDTDPVQLCFNREEPITVVVLRPETTVNKGAVNLWDAAREIANLELSRERMEFVVIESHIVCIANWSRFVSGEVQEFIHFALDWAESLFGLHFQAAVGPCVDRLDDLSSAYQKALFTANMYSFGDAGAISYYDKDRTIEIEPQKAFMSYVDISELTCMAAKNDLKGLEDAFYVLLKKNSLLHKDRALMENFLAFLIFSLNNHCIASGKISYQQLNRNIDAIHTLMGETKISTCTKLLAQVYFESLQPNFQNSAYSVIERARSYIDSHFSGNLSLDMVAANVFMSKNYFSTLFKQSQNMGFTDYLNKVRIEKAIELLKNPDNKILDISARVGYTSYRYFNYQFQKIMGQTPTEYRYHSVDGIREDVSGT
jgi:two-component system response regulator YesN